MDTSRNDLLGAIAADAALERSDFLVQATDQLRKFLDANKNRISELGGLVLIDEDPDYLSIAPDLTFRSRTRYLDDLTGEWTSETEVIESASELVELYNPADLYQAFADAAREAAGLEAEPKPRATSWTRPASAWTRASPSAGPIRTPPPPTNGPQPSPSRSRSTTTSSRPSACTTWPSSSRSGASAARRVCSKTGIMQGMSGSPVYIDGKLLGAVALGFPFSKEPIAGIQPIEEMISEASGSGDGQSQGSAVPVMSSWRFHGMNLLKNLSASGASDSPDAPVATPFGSLSHLLIPLSVSGLANPPSVRLEMDSASSVSNRCRAFPAGELENPLGRYPLDPRRKSFPAR